jgi:hypothetical protein
MADNILLYISAANDLEVEKDLLGRVITEIPVTMGWKITHTPTKGGSPDLNAIREADVHLFLLGSDIRAPLGFELLTSNRSGKKPELFLKKNLARTPAALVFIREIKTLAEWRYFENGAELRYKVLQLMADHILNRVNYYDLGPDEYRNLKSWQEHLTKSKVEPQEEIKGGTGKNGMIFSIDRYEPSEGYLIDEDKIKKND